MRLKDIAKKLGVSKTTVDNYIKKYDLRNGKDETVWTDAKCAALRVEFLTSREELFCMQKPSIPL